MDVSAQQTQVFHQKGPILGGVLSVEAILDILAHINLIDDLICIFLQSRCKNHNFVIFGHRFDKLDAARSNQEKAIILVLNIVDQGFVKIENQRVDIFLRMIKRIQEWRRNFGQILEVVGEYSLLTCCDS